MNSSKIRLKNIRFVSGRSNVETFEESLISKPGKNFESHGFKLLQNQHTQNETFFVLFLLDFYYES